MTSPDLTFRRSPQQILHSVIHPTTSWISPLFFAIVSFWTFFALSVGVVMPSSPARSLTLLHLSDLHFGQEPQNGSLAVYESKVLKELVLDVLRICQSRGAPDLIVITGNLT
ncbi:MAG: hypothetical protein ACKO6N_28970, partial [Myxococcota bacterium]